MIDKDADLKAPLLGSCVECGALTAWQRPNPQDANKDYLFVCFDHVSCMVLRTCMSRARKQSRRFLGIMLIFQF